MKSFTGIVCFIVFLLFPLRNNAQNYEVYFKHITVKEGISDNYVHSIIQDSLGFIWMGTEAGLNRYDGYNSKVFQHVPGNDQGLSSNYIKVLHLHASGKIWVGTDAGIDIFDPLTETIVHIGKKEGLIHNEVQAIGSSSHGGLWIGTAGGLQYATVNVLGLPTRFDSFLPDHTDPTSIHTTSIYSVLEASDGSLWIGSNTDGLGKMNPWAIGEKPVFRGFPSRSQDSLGISNGAVMIIYEDSKGRIWVGNWAGGLHLYLPEEDGFEHFMPDPQQPESLNSQHVYTLCEDLFGEIWVGTYGGGLSKIIETKKPGGRIGFQSFTFDYLGMDPIRDYRIRTLFLDRSGVLWAGSLGGGVKSVNQKPQEFHFFHGDWGKNIRNKKYEISALAVDRQDRIWAGIVNEGVECMSFDPDARQFHLLRKFRYVAHNPKGLSSDKVHVLYEDQQENIWIGTENGLNCLQKNGSKELIRYFHDPSNPFSLTHSKILSIKEDEEGQLWIGTAKGLNLYDPKEDHFINLQNNVGFVFEFTEEDDIAIFSQTQSGNYFAGGEWFFGEFDKDKRIGEFFWEAGKKETEYLRYRPNYMLESSAGGFWLGTQRGLSRFVPEKGFSHFKGEEDLSVYMVTSIMEDRLFQLWLGTPAGLVKFNPMLGTIKHYDMKGRTSHNDLSAGAVCKTSDGTTFLGSQDGLIYFTPTQFLTNDYHVPVVINDLKISAQSVPVGKFGNGRQVLQQSICSTPEISLSHTDQVITLEFVALDFSQQHEYQYAYMLEGVEDHWNYTDANNRSVSYGKLAPGSYTFKVKVAQSPEIGDGQLTHLKIHVQPPFWKTNIAYLCYTAFLILLISASKRYTKKRMELENQLKIEKLEQEKIAEVNQIKLDFFTNISHELKTPLTLILGPLERLRKQVGDNNRETVYLMYRNTQKLLRLIDQLMDFRKQEAGGIRLAVHEQKLIPFLKDILHSFKGLAEERHISLVFLPDTQDLRLWYDANQLEKVIYNLLSNAFKFTSPKGTIALQVETHETYVDILLTDDGIGIPPEDLPFIFDRFYQSTTNSPFNQRGTGIGLSFSKHIVDLHKGEISALSTAGEGSCFTVRLQKGSAHFAKEEIAEKITTNIPPMYSLLLVY